MAFLASTFIIHGCVPPKIHLFPSKSHDFTFNRKIGQTNISNNKAGLEKPVEFADGVINVELK